MANIHDSSIIKLFQATIIKQKGKIWMRMNCKQLMKWRLFGKEFIIYDTFDNPLFLVKQIAKFIRTSNVNQMLSKSEFTKSILLMQQWSKAWNNFVFTTKKSLKRLEFQNREKLETEV